MLTKKTFWIMIGFWSVTVASLIIGLSCIGQKTDKITDATIAQKNGFDFIQNDYKHGSVGAILDPGFMKDVSGRPVNADRKAQAMTLQNGVAFSVIIVPIMAVGSGLSTAAYWVISNREWKKHLPKNYVPKSRQRLMEQQALKATSSHPAGENKK